MKLRNPFSPKARELFDEAKWCWECGENGVDALHHILGRVSSSPFNAAPVHNFGCHIGRGDIHHDAVQSRYLKKTARYLEEIGYQPTQKDLEFIEENKKLYEKDHI